LLEWPAQTSARSDSSGKTTATVTERRNDPLDAQASAPALAPALAPAASDSFEALWRGRIEQR
jgi:hypothetical protein